MERRIRVLLADDHPLMLNSIRQLLILEPDMMVVAEATDGYASQHLIRTYCPDILLLDLNMPGPTTTEMIAYAHTHCSETRVIVLTAYDDDIYVRGLLAAGAAGYVLKDEMPEIVVQAIRSVVQGGVWLSARVAERVFPSLPEVPTPHTIALTDREMQVLKLLVANKTNHAIAAKLDISEKTVEKHLTSLFTKLGVATRLEAAVLAVRSGLA